MSRLQQTPGTIISERMQLLVGDGRIHTILDSDQEVPGYPQHTPEILCQNPVPHTLPLFPCGRSHDYSHAGDPGQLLGTPTSLAK